MDINKPIKRALFSLTDQAGVLDFARQLISLGWEIIATKETTSLLKENNIEAKDFSDFFKIDDSYPFPPTLHPKLEAALTANSENAIDLVYITTYPLTSGNDVGGHTILALAAKGNKIPVSKKEDMHYVIQCLQKNNNCLPEEIKNTLVKKTYAKIAKHYLQLQYKSENLDDLAVIVGKKLKQLSWGENPYQVPADLFKTSGQDSLALPNFEQVAGGSPCYTNIADFDSILKTIGLAAETFFHHYRKQPFIAIAAKHGNPCGLAIDWRFPEVAVEKALFGNPVAIFGGEVITNFEITEFLAEKLYQSEKLKEKYGRLTWCLDLIAAPNFADGAVKILKQRKKIKLFKNKNLTNPQLEKSKWFYRMMRGGFLRQPQASYILDLNELDRKQLNSNSEILDSLIIAFAAAWTSSHGGNEIAIAKDGALLSCAGGPSTVEACQTAVSRAKQHNHDLKNSIFTADSFFPFTDGPGELAGAGCQFGLVPAGGKYFEKIKNYFDEKNVKMIYLPENIRGFCRH